MWDDFDIGDKIRYFDGKEYIEGIFTGYWGNSPDLDDPEDFGDGGIIIKQDNGHEVCQM